MKHAYLIITHQYTPILETLVKMIDDERNDIYVHVDKKARDSYAGKITALTNKSEIHFVRKHKVYWGHVSLVKAEYELFQAAYNHGGYNRYHLISGSDLPIKSQDTVHDFFDSHPDEEFISFTKDELTERVLYKWLFPRHFLGFCSNKTWAGRKINKVQAVATRTYIEIQKKLGLKNRAFDCYKKGSEWVSLTPKAVEVLLKNRKRALRAFRFANCPDEHYKHTVLYNYNNQQAGQSLRFYQYPKRAEVLRAHPNACLLDSARYIPWEKGSLSLTNKDYNEIVNSDAMFCRKVVDEELAKMLYSSFGPKE